MNGTAPFQGFVLAADGNNDKGKSFNVDGSTTSLSDFGYFFVHQAHTNTNINRGLVNGANITFRFVPSPSQYYNEPVWCPYLPGGLLTHGAFNLLRSCASFSDASLNFNGGNLLQDLGNGNFYLDGIYSGQWAKYTLTSQTILTLNGGDVLTAGPNPDTFDYVAGQDGIDTIRQFNPTQDNIRLHGATAADIQLHTVSTDTYIELSNNGVQRGILVEDVTQQQLSPRIAFSPTTDGVPKECASGIVAPAQALQVNGEPLPINPGEVKVVGQGLVYRDTGKLSDKYAVVGAAGDGAEIRIKATAPGKEHINVKPFLASDRAPGTVSGMLGDNNGNAADDLQLPDGTVLPRPVPSTMLQQHATSWCAENPPHQPLIIPRPGESTMSCDDPKFTGEDPRDEFTTQQLADARQVVLDAGVNATNPFIEELTLDAAAGLPVEDIALDLATLSGNGTDITEVVVIPEDPSCFSELPPPPGGYKRVIAGTPGSDNTTVVFSQNYVYTRKERDTIRIERGSVDNEIRNGCNDGVIDTVTIANDRKGNPEVRRTHDENLPEFGEEDQLQLEGYCPSDLQIVPVGDTGSVVKLPGRNLWVERVAPSQLERQITFTNPDCVGEVSAGTRHEPFLLPLLVPAARVAQDWVGRFVSNENAPEVKIEELPPTATIDPTTVIRTPPIIEEVTDISQEGVLAPYRSFTPGNEKAGAWGIISQNEPPCYYPDGSFNVAYEEGDIPDNALVGPCAYPKAQGNRADSGQDMTMQCAGVLGSSAVTEALLRAVPDILENLMKRQGFGAWTSWGTAKLAQGLLLYYCTSSLVTTGVTTAIRAAVRGALTYFEFDEETIKFFETGFDGGAKALMCYTNPTLALTSMAGHYVGDACGGYVAEEFRRRCLPSTGEKEVA